MLFQNVISSCTSGIGRNAGWTPGINSEAGYLN